MIGKALVACEESQAVCIALRAKGWEAYSCDILPCSGGHPEWHIQDDVRNVLYRDWDMIIAFPDCTFLTVANTYIKRGCSKYSPEQALIYRQKAKDFFMLFVNHPCKLKSTENPIGIMSTEYRKPDQIIQPWQYGHGETKPTCLWLTGLPKLKPTNIVEGRESRIHKMPPSKDRAKLRSKTYAGIAQAMADQWTDFYIKTVCGL